MNIDIKSFQEYKTPVNTDELVKELRLVNRALKDPYGLVDGKRINLKLFYRPFYGTDLCRTYSAHSGWLAELYTKLDSPAGADDLKKLAEVLKAYLHKKFSDFQQ
ncbi:hypothetical protein FACS1894110_14620 [Spirochaetia bacterium]|nr:hypothetical protein FACS1894110_14620 [Spirochaetia bacterium]